MSGKVLSHLDHVKLEVLSEGNRTRTSPVHLTKTLVKPQHPAHVDKHALALNAEVQFRLFNSLHMHFFWSVGGSRREPVQTQEEYAKSIQKDPTTFSLLHRVNQVTNQFV